LSVTDLLDQGSRWLDDQRLRHLSRPVTYCRGTASAEVQAAVGRTVFEVDNGAAVLEQIGSRDFLVRVADLVLGGEQTLPQRGGRIRETQDGVTYVYEVMAPVKEPHYVLDRYRRTLRIHTKLVDTE
jgi:hypothetical protein